MPRKRSQEAKNSTIRSGGAQPERGIKGGPGRERFEFVTKVSAVGRSKTCAKKEEPSERGKVEVRTARSPFFACLLRPRGVMERWLGKTPKRDIMESHADISTAPKSEWIRAWVLPQRKNTRGESRGCYLSFLRLLRRFQE